MGIIIARILVISCIAMCMATVWLIYDAISSKKKCQQLEADKERAIKDRTARENAMFKISYQQGLKAGIKTEQSRCYGKGFNAGYQHRAEQEHYFEHGNTLFYKPIKRRRQAV